MDIRTAMRERRQGQEWFDSLPREDKWAVGDDFVLGCFDWREHFDTKPSVAFLRGADYSRMLWEECGAP